MRRQQQMVDPQTLIPMPAPRLVVPEGVSVRLRVECAVCVGQTEIEERSEPRARLGPAESIVTEADRREAIQQAVRDASPGDVVLIAGKGHEKYQEIGGRKLAFDDIAVAREALEARRVKSRA